MRLLVFICNNPEKLEEVLEGYLEVGITGATIVDSLGMGHTLATQVPIFAGFQPLFSAASAYNKTILSVIKEASKVEEALDMIEEICGPLGEPGVGIAFTVSLESVRGLMPELE